MNKSLKTIMRRAAVLVAAAMLALTFAGCGSSEPFVDEEGNPIYYKFNELGSGIYIQFPELGHRRPLPYGMRFSGSYDDINEDRILWFKGAMEYLIPEVDDNTNFIYISDARPPEEMYIEHFRDTCYSFGGLFKINRDGSISFSSNSDDICAGSSFAKALAGEVGSASNTTVTELGTAEDINAPFSSGLLSDWGYVSGLTKNAAYKIGYFEGTKYNSFYISADTHYYHQDGVYKVEGFTPTKDGYFIIELPEELPSGIYCIDGVGVFNYTAGFAPSMGPDAASDESVIPSSTLPPEEIIHDTIGSGTKPSTTPALESTPTTEESPAPVTTPNLASPIETPASGPVILTPEQGTTFPTATPGSPFEIMPVN